MVPPARIERATYSLGENLAYVLFFEFLSEIHLIFRVFYGIVSQEKVQKMKETAP